jgi:group I intron endonuclease
MYGTIYHITNLHKGKVYVGQTTQNYNLRCYHHFRKLVNGTHWNAHLQSAYNLYGVNGFISGSIYHAVCQEELDAAEDMFIIYYNSLGKMGYNQSGGGAFGPMTDEIKAKISAANTGRLVSKSTRKKISATKSRNFWKGKFSLQTTSL